MLSPVILLANRLHGQSAGIREPVDDGGLADAGRSHKGRRGSPRQILPHSFETRLFAARLSSAPEFPGAMLSTSAARAAASGQRSALLSNTTGRAPLSHTMVK